MGRDLSLFTSDGVPYSYENIRTQGWLDGHRPGIEMAAGWFRERAVELFRSGLDERARDLRQLAERMEKELGSKVEIRANEHRTDHPEMLVVFDERAGT